MLNPSGNIPAVRQAAFDTLLMDTRASRFDVETMKLIGFVIK
jgi:hypothetical protein